MRTSDQTSSALIAALSEARIPVENHEFIRQITNAAGVDGYRAVDQTGKPYVIATRPDGLRDLHIYYGGTNGFTTEDEAIRIAGGDVDRGLSGSRKGTWFVLHPVNQARIGDERSRNIRRQSTYCECGMQLSLTGVCDSCD